MKTYLIVTDRYACFMQCPDLDHVFEFAKSYDPKAKLKIIAVCDSCQTEDPIHEFINSIKKDLQTKKN